MWRAFIPNSSDEETVNNAFCTNSLFRISSETKVSELPAVQAQIQNKRMLVSVDNSLIILQDENVMECNLMSFGASIDCFAISHSGNLVVCALADGNIHGIFIKGMPIFNMSVKEEDVGKSVTFAGIKQVEENYYLVCTNGKIYRLYNIDEKMLENYPEDTVCENESRLYNDTFLKDTILERITSPKVDKVIKSFCCVTSHETDGKLIGNELFLMLCSDRRVYIEENDRFFAMQISDSIGALKSIYNLDQMIIGLSFSGYLFEICPFTKIIFEPFNLAVDYLIDDFLVLENNLDDIELLLLTKPNQAGHRWMKIVTFPSMKCKSELIMPKYTWLVQQQKTAVNMYYMTGDSPNEQDFPQELEMKIISETQPLERLKKLIYKGRLDEAEQFGRQFNLNLQAICEAKAKRKLLEISALNENQITIIQEKFAELLEIFNTIENKDFFLSLCGFEIPSREVMEIFLNEILSRLDEERFLQNVFEIKEQLLRIETLNLIDPYETNLQWQKFVYHPNVVKVCLSLFKTDILSASLVWKRHAACVIPQLDIQSVLHILNAIPQATEAFHVVQWLRYFIPSVLQVHVTAMSHLVEWSIQKTRSLQYSTHWPEIGLEFSMKIKSIFEEIEFLYSDFRRQYDSNITKLKKIVSALKNLSRLKKSYNLIISLDNYLKDSLDETALRILQGVQLSNLKNVVNDFLCPIYLEKGETPNCAIKWYINYLVNNRRNISFWLERAVTSISLLHNEEEKLECALLVLKNSSVPWPESVTPLLKLSFSSHPLAAEIRAQYDLQVVKILKQKYGWSFDSPDNHMKLAFRIVKVDLPEMLGDIEKLVKVCPEISGSTYFYCCYELARKGQTQRAVQFLRTLKHNERSECYDKIISILSDMLSNSPEDLAEFDSLFEFLKAIALDSDKCHYRSLMDLQRVYLLDKKFHLKISLDCLTSKKELRNALSSGIDTIEKCSKRKQTNIIHFIWTELSELASLLGFEKIFVILQFAKKMNQLDLSCAVAYLVLDLEQVTKANSEMYIDLAALLVGQHIDSVVVEAETPKNDPLVYPLAYKLLIEAMKFGKVLQFEVIELLKWVCIGNEMYSLSALQEFYGNIREIDKKISEKIIRGNITNGEEGEMHINRRESISIFDQICDIPDTRKPGNDPSLVTKCISVALFIASMEETSMEKPFRINLFINDSRKNNESDVRLMLASMLESLVKCKQYNSWYKLIHCIKRYQCFDTIMPTKSLLSNKLKMFKFLISSKDPNFTDIFAMLIADPNCEVYLKYLENELRTGHSKLNFLILSEMYHTHVGDHEKIALDREQRMKYYYYTELIKQDSALKFKANIEFISISMLVRELKNKLLDVSLLSKLSGDFDWDYQQVLVAQVITALNMQEPLYDIKTDAMGKEEMVMKITTERIRDVCQPYLTEITNTGLLASKLLSFLADINFYFYELYLCVIDILTYINALPKEMELWSNILLFLKHKMVTKRRHRAGQMEMDWWLKSQQDVGVLPKIAKYRFPFMPLVQEPLKNILDDEVNVDNCESWFPLIKLLTVNQGKTSPSEIVQEQEYFCMSAVKNSISEYKQQSEEDADVWHLQPINNAFLQSILRLIRNMTNLPKILFILYFVTNHAREGADQVEAAGECYKFAITNEKHLVTNKKAEETVIKIKRKYPLIKTQHLLHIYGLADEKLLELAENPKGLIHALYHHDAILQSHKSNINSLVCEIALLHGLNFRTIQISMVQSWLSNATTMGVSDADETFYEDLNSSLNGTSAINNEHIIRAHYILHSWKSTDAAEFLVGLLFPVDGPVDTGKQLQIFECFCKLIDETSASYISAINQDQYIALKCVHYMKQLGYNVTVEKFMEYDKLNILKKIWEKHANNKLALEAVSYICISHEIFMPKIWSSVLKQMANLNMVSNLNGLLDMLSCKASLLNTDGLVSAWECVLRDPFKNASRLRCYEQDMLLSKNLFRIQACPIIKKLDLVAFAEDCIRLGRPHMAAVFVALANKDQKDLIIAMICKQKTDNLRAELIELEEAGIAPIIVNFVLKKLNL